MGSLIQTVAKLQNYAEFAELNWSGTFEEYLQIVQQKPEVTRTAYQRLYDMILSYGVEKVMDNKKEMVRYRFFDDPVNGGKEAIYGLAFGQCA